MDTAMKKRDINVIDMVPISRKKLAPVDFISFAKNKESQIKSTRFILPKIGSDSFGEFEVELNNPTYEFID